MNLKDSRGYNYNQEEAERLIDAAWGVQHLIPHPDDVNSPEDARAIRQFNRALIKLPPLEENGT